jgi:hypothetical protein
MDLPFPGNCISTMAPVPVSSVISFILINNITGLILKSGLEILDHIYVIKKLSSTSAIYL